MSQIVKKKPEQTRENLKAKTYNSIKQIIALKNISRMTHMYMAGQYRKYFLFFFEQMQAKMAILYAYSETTKLKMIVQPIQSAFSHFLSLSLAFFFLLLCRCQWPFIRIFRMSLSVFTVQCITNHHSFHFRSTKHSSIIKILLIEY